ncbi:MAG: secretion protein, partial [Flavobacterium sp.]
MKKQLLSFAMIALTGLGFAQNGVWKATTKKATSITLQNKTSLTKPKFFELDVTALKQSLAASPARSTNGTSNVVVAFPNADAQMEHFRVMKNSNMDPELEAKYPEIMSYVGEGIENPSSTIYFSVSPLGVETMTIYADRSAVFIEPYTTDGSTYAVYRKSDRMAAMNAFDCKVISAVQPQLGESSTARPNADDALLRTYRLAMSVTGEYTTYFGGTKALALAAINNTMTRVNGVFEKDFSARMVLIANTDTVIYTNASTDPYSAASTGAGGAWNQELQTTLTNNIGSANYDIGHLFGATGGGGNAGCIGCICTNPT